MSRGEHLDSVGIESHVMDINSANRQLRNPLPPPSNGNGCVDQWSQLANQQNGHDVRFHFIHFIVFFP